MNPDHACRCDGAGHCPIYRRRMTPRHQRLCCNGDGDLSRQSEFRALWRRTAPPAGLGDYVARWLDPIARFVGLKQSAPTATESTGCSGCAKRQQTLNQIAGPHHPLTKLAALPHALSNRKSAIENQQSTDPPQVAPVTPRRIHWAIGITTAPRRSPTLARSYQSLMAAGFAGVPAYVFAEPNSPQINTVRNADTAIIQRPATIAPARFDTTESDGRLGCWRNYVQSLADLYAAHPDADAYLIVQDDAEFAPELREFLDRDLWPSQECGAVSLYCPAKYEQDTGADAVGLKRISESNLCGAVAIAIPREALRQILDSPQCKDWRGAATAKPTKEPHLKKAADAWLGRVLKSLGLRAYFYVPSLVDHFATTSAVGHGGNKGRVRNSRRFQPVSPFEVWRNREAPLRFELPSGRRRYRDWSGAIPRIHVALPIVDHPELTNRCLTALAANHVLLLVHLVCNGSTDQTVELVTAHAASIGLPVELTRWPQNRGFTPAVNVGLLAAREAVQPALILNNDCRLAPHAIERMWRALAAEKDIAAVGPLTMDTGRHSLRRADRQLQAGITQPARRGDLIGVEQSLKLADVIDSNVLAFFCTLISARALQTVKGLPPDFADGLGADDLWCRVARKRGLRLQIVLDAYADHDHSATFRALQIDRRAAQRAAAEKLRRSKPKRKRRKRRPAA